MSDEEHLSLIRQGVAVWNHWRKDNPGTSPDLSKASLSKANLSNANLSKANLRGADLHGANLNEAVLSETDLRGADLDWAELRNADLRNADFRSADFNGADLNGAAFSRANLTRAALREAKLTEADLSGANLSEADLRRAKFNGANLSEADLRRAKFNGANLSEADLSGAHIRRADLRRAILSGADLSGAHIRGADLRGAIFGLTILGNIDLSQVKGLERVRHHSPSTIGIDTIYLSGGNIPEKFLRGCGLSDLQIATAKLHRRGLTNEEVTDLTYDIHHLIILGAIHSHSTFISYSMKDQVFADKLYDDLQNHGVRCWFATEDMPIGGKLRDEIDHAISRRENVVLILSENALNSRWVEDEVEKAFEVEKERGQRILLPVRLDNTVLETDKPWARKICRRLVGDFRGWADDRAYRREFDRLLRGIKAAAEAED